MSEGEINMDWRAIGADPGDGRMDVTSIAAITYVGSVVLMQVSCQTQYLSDENLPHTTPIPILTIHLRFTGALQGIASIADLSSN